MLSAIFKLISPKTIVVIVIFVLLIGAYYTWLSQFSMVHINIGATDIALPVPVLVEKLARKPLPTDPTSPVLPTYALEVLTQQKDTLVADRRQSRIDKVEKFFRQYGSSLVGYGHIFVDEAEQCGGDYRVLVGIAGSESGLGRVNYLKYNPFGYLDHVQYSSEEEALTILACKISQQHIAKCGTDLWCLAYRYAGPGDDLNLFVSKVSYFFSQVN